MGGVKTGRGISEDVRIDDANDVIEIYGIRYSGEIFREMAFAKIYSEFQIIDREDGVISLRKIPIGGRG